MSKITEVRISAEEAKRLFDYCKTNNTIFCERLTTVHAIIENGNYKNCFKQIYSNEAAAKHYLDVMLKGGWSIPEQDLINFGFRKGIYGYRL